MSSMLEMRPEGRRISSFSWSVHHSRGVDLLTMEQSLARARAFLGGYAEPRERGLIELPSLGQFHVSLKLAQCSPWVRAVVR